MKRLIITVLFLLSIAACPAGADVEVLGLFTNAALLRIDGEQKLVKTGQVWRNVAVLKADSRKALLDINGVRQTLTVSQRISTNYVKPVHSEVLIPTNDQRQYITNANINGRTTRVLVDTGANIVALNMTTARSLGIDFERGIPGRVSTAGGNVKAWRVMLDSVDVGGIRVNHVEASVVAGTHPETVLLGMSYLQHVKMSERDGLLVLSRKF